MNTLRRFVLSLPALALLALVLALPSHAATTGTPNNLGTGPAPVTAPPTGLVPPALDPRVKFSAIWSCDLAAPAEVQGYHVVCAGGTFLDFYSADCCLPFDHWELKGKNWDDDPNTAVTTAPGPANVFGVPGRVYTYGANPLDAYIECTYIHGINVFPASSPW